jgi:hypothetical protein
MRNKRLIIRDKEIIKKLNLKPNKSQRYRLDNFKRKEYYQILAEQQVKTESTTSDNDYKETFFLSAWCPKTNTILTIKQYCVKYNLPYEDISSFKFLPYHYKEPSYNIVFKDKQIDDAFDYEELKKTLAKELKKTHKPLQLDEQTNTEGVLKWADLHFGAMIEGLVKTRDFNTQILKDGLLTSVEDFNNIRFGKRHVHIQGDLIESFTGLNHINSWHSMDSKMIGATVIKLCTKLLDEALSKINNLETVKIIGGNHDRISKDNKEDVKGGAAEIIAYCLELLGYNVEFHPYVISHEVQGINHIILHGDKKVSSKTSEEIVSLYGAQGKYNFITEAHLHRAMEKLTAKQRSKYQVIQDDKLMLRRLTLKPFFTGNYYSETLGYNTNAGYSIIWANNKGRPKMLDNTI